MGVLTGKVAIVTGATSGLGVRIAERFIAEGAEVVIAGRRGDEAAQVAARLGSRASYTRTDVSQEADLHATVAHALDRFGHLDCLVNNAGSAGTPGGVRDIEHTDFEHTMTVHVWGVLAGMKHAAPALIAQGSGSIINMASVGGQLAGWSAYDYSVAKAAVMHATRCAAVELGEHGVRVNSISPGPIPTGIQAKTAGMAPAAAQRATPLLEPVFTQRLADWQPARRLGTPDDVASAALWLASDASTFVNGHDITVDGGIHAGRPASVSAADRTAIADALSPNTK